MMRAKVRASKSAAGVFDDSLFLILCHGRVRLGVGEWLESCLRCSVLCILTCVRTIAIRIWFIVFLVCPQDGMFF